MLVRTDTAEATEAFGARLAEARPQGPVGFTTFHLTGDLGAGKTTLTRGFLRALGVTGAVRSPTYTLVETYECGPLTVVHLDLYRLSDPAELENLGLREWARTGCVWLVEWPERGADRLPDPDVVVALRTAEAWHEIQSEARTPAGAAWLQRLPP